MNEGDDHTVWENLTPSELQPIPNNRMEVKGNFWSYLGCCLLIFSIAIAIAFVMVVGAALH